MKVTVYHEGEGCLVTLDDVTYTDDNTTWFTETNNSREVAMITDYQGGLLIKNCGYCYPIWLYDVSRAEIGFSRRKARALLKRLNY